MSQSTNDLTDENKKENPIEEASTNENNLWRGLMLQAWAGIAVWMTFGLLLEGLIGFRIPTYFADPTRREMFRLAHAHGTLLSLVLLGAAFSVTKNTLVPKFALRALQIGTILMPLGFLIGGIQHFSTEPGFAIWLVPPAALLVIFGAVTIAVSCLKKR